MSDQFVLTLQLSTLGTAVISLPPFTHFGLKLMLYMYIIVFILVMTHQIIAIFMSH